MAEAEKPIILVEDEFKMIADTAPVMIWMAGTDKLCYFFNARWLIYTGRTLQQEQGNGWAEGVHPEDFPRVLETYHQAFDAREEFKIEYRLRRFDGNYCWLVDTGMPRFTANGNFAGYIGSCVDISDLLDATELRAAYINSEALHREQALNEELAASNEELAAVNEELASTNEELQASNEELLVSKQSLASINDELEQRVARRTQQLMNAQAQAENQSTRLKRFFMQAPAGICILHGVDLVFELVNPLYQQLFPGRQLLGLPLLEAIPELNNQPLWGIIQQVYQTGETFEGKEMLVQVAQKHNGPIEYRYFNFTYQAQLDRFEQINGVIVFAVEVTDAVLTKQRIEDAARRLQTQLNAIPQIAWTNNVSGEVDFYNQKWYDYTGLDFESTKAWGWKEVIHPDDLQHNLDSYASILKSNNGGEFEIREKRKDGVFRWHLVRMLPIKNEHGEIESWIGTATDIDDLKVLQQQKDDFISIASHELKTPLTSLKASLQILDRIKEQPATNMLPKLVVQANRSVDKISELISDLLDASRINETQLEISRSNFKIAHMLEGCCSYVKMDERYELVIEGDTQLEINADEHRVEQVIENLVNNAVKYAPESKYIYLNVEREDGFVKISVKDTGPGISAEKLPLLFSKYYRAGYTGAQYSGLGLGLYISAEIVRRHNGQIGVTSEPGEGCVFWFTLPL